MSYLATTQPRILFGDYSHQVKQKFEANKPKNNMWTHRKKNLGSIIANLLTKWNCVTFMCHAWGLAIFMHANDAMTPS